MRVLTGLLILGVTGAAGTQFTAQNDPAAEEQCKAEQEAFIEVYRARRYDGAEAREELLEEVERLIERYRAKAPVCEGRLRNSEAYLLVLNKRYEDLIERTGEFLEREGANTEADTRALLRMQRGYTFEVQGQALASAQEYLTAATLAREVPARRGGRTLVYASIATRELGNYDAAQRYIEEAVDLYTDSLETDPTLKGDLGAALITKCYLIDQRLSLTSDSAERRRLIASLEQSAERAVDLVKAWDARSPSFQAQGMSFQALAAAYDGRYEQAIARIEPAVALAETGSEVAPQGLPEVWLVWSRIAELQGDLQGAREAALQLQRVARRQSLAEYEALAFERLGSIAEAEGDWQEARAAYVQAIDYRETKRERIGLQDWTAQAFALMQEPYRGLVRTHLATGDVRSALQTLDQTQARYLRDLRRHLDVRARLSPDERVVADSLAKALEEARLALLDEGVNGAERAERMQTISELQETLERITGSDLSPAPQFNVDRLQQALGTEQRTLIAYTLDDRASAAIVVRTDTIVAVPLQVTPSEIRDQLRALGSPWQDRTAPDPAFALPPLHRLYQALVAPLEPWLDGTRSLTVVPDGVLGAVPFSMLVTAPAESYEEASYLIRRFPITTELAASLVGTDEKDAGRETGLDLLAYGRSQFASMKGVTDDRPLSDLPYVDDELRRVTRRVGESRVVKGNEATEAGFQRDLSTARIVHVASHAEAHPTLPLYSRIYLHDAPDESDDGVVYLYEIQERSLPAELVVLSGCSTASGVSYAGEGIIGLQYAVRTAGAEASLATLWPVDDEAIVTLMDAFYKGLSRGLPKDEALQQAQLEYLEHHQDLEASPFYWASPVLSGSPSPIPLQPRSQQRWLIAALLAGVGLGLAWWFRKHHTHA